MSCEKGNKRHMYAGNECFISVTANVIKNMFAGVHFLVVSMYCFSLIKPTTSQQKGRYKTSYED